MKIYKITNTVDGKIYIGQTVQRLSERFRDHTRGDKQPDGYLHRAIKKHGIENFVFEEIDSAKTLEGLNALEEHYIQKFNSLAPNGYNLLLGGTNRRQHEDTKKKLSALNKGKVIPNRWTKGNTVSPSEETRKLISKKLKGRPIKNRMNGAPKGRPVSEERRAMISKTMIGQAQPWKYKAVQNIETGEIYVSIQDAAAKLNLHRVTISAMIKKGTKLKLKE